MRKKMKQTAALALALGMAAAGSAAGYAKTDVTPTEVTDVAVVDEAGAAGTKTELVGMIDVTSLSVTLPLKAGFNIDPGKFDESSFTAQIGDNQSSAYKIINNSAVPVWVYISAVSTNKYLDDTTTGLTDIDLVNNTTALSDPHKVMLAIKEAGSGTTLPATPDTKTDFWLGTDTNPGTNGKYFLSDNKGKLEAKSQDGAATEMQLKVYGLTKNGWQQGDKFAVTPSFMVSTTEP